MSLATGRSAFQPRADRALITKLRLQQQASTGGNVCLSAAQPFSKPDTMDASVEQQNVKEVQMH